MFVSDDAITHVETVRQEDMVLQHWMFGVSCMALCIVVRSFRWLLVVISRVT